MTPQEFCFPDQMRERNTVLVVDDEEFDRAAISSAIRSTGCPVLQAQSYSDGMAVFDANRNIVGLLIADIALPDGNGCALAIALHKQQPELRVLFVSGHVGAEVCKYYGLDVAALHFLRKPFKAADLLKRIEEVLASAEPFPQLYPPKVFTSSGYPTA
jgi:two-component system, cell cycle sensor histidine kinase and response regulator CckA